MRKATQKEMQIANMEALMFMIFKNNFIAYAIIFFASFIILEPVEANKQLSLIKEYANPLLATYIYYLVASYLNKETIHEETLIGEIKQFEKLNRKELSSDKITAMALHEAAHFIALLNEDYENYIEVIVGIEKVSIKSNSKFQMNTLQSIYNTAFIKYIPYVVEKKYFSSSWEKFTNSADSKDFELLVRTYLLNSENTNYFINPINEIEANYNAKLINELRKQIEHDCELFIDKYEAFLIEAKNILIERDIHTIEAKELLHKWKNSSIGKDQ